MLHVTGKDTWCYLVRDASYPEEGSPLGVILIVGEGWEREALQRTHRGPCKEEKGAISPTSGWDNLGTPVPWHHVLGYMSNSVCSQLIYCIQAYSTDLFLHLHQITLMTSWKEVKKLIKEDPRCIKFSSSDRVRPVFASWTIWNCCTPFVKKSLW